MMLANGRGPFRILVCDDERHIVRLLQSNLKRQGHTVVCAFDGREAIDLLETESRFDIVVLDTVMPNVDGLEVLKWMRSREPTRETKVALMLARPEDRETLALGPYTADLYITKPFGPDDLFR